jgi:hypothetical protein
LDDLYFLVQKINDRKLQEYKMELAIVQNPHVKEPRRLWDILKSQEQREKDDEFDAIGFEILKDRLRQSRRFIVK